MKTQTITNNNKQIIVFKGYNRVQQTIHSNQHKTMI
jgi:hypothetical protein